MAWSYASDAPSEKSRRFQADFQRTTPSATGRQSANLNRLPRIERQFIVKNIALSFLLNSRVRAVSRPRLTEVFLLCGRPAFTSEKEVLT
jgi:hypothetical protein